MKTYINEVFSSIQGEGKLVGRRQIFIRFSGCNLYCNYCDTSQSRDPLSGNQVSTDDLFQIIDGLITPDFHSISLTGGEPLLHAEFIRSFLEIYEFKCLLETNGSLPTELEKIASLISYASVDIKLPEHQSTPHWEDLISHEMESINLLIDEDANTYCKVVVLPTTKVDLVGYIASMISKEVSDDTKVSMVIQPVSPLDLWINETNKLFEISEKAGEYLDVLLIPQLHQLLNFR